MIADAGTSMTSLTWSFASRRWLSRRSRRVLVGLLVGRLAGRRPALDRAARGFLRLRSRSYLARVMADRGFALAAAALLVSCMATTTTMALPPVNLSDVAAGTGGFVIKGISLDDNSGYSVSGAGDVNGDGLTDLIVGAPYADPGGNADAGQCYVVFGKANGTQVSLADVVAGIGGFVINGTSAGDTLGYSCAGAGDVNGDGLADLIVAAPLADPGGIDAVGECYVVFGKADTTPVSLADVAAGTGGFVLKGIDFRDNAGHSVASAGDVNGDGLADLVVGAQHANQGANGNAGEVYVVFGKTDTTPVSLGVVAAGIGGFIINGIDPYDHAGNSVSGAGDVNGDGLADVVLSASLVGDNLGYSYVIFGKADGTAVNLTDVNAGIGGFGFVIHGIDPGDFSGHSVSGAGDVNGDGLADVIVGSPNADPGRVSSAGESYVVFGKADTAAVSLSDVVAGIGGFVINGIDTFDRAGWAVSDAGDVNNDGLADLIVGARDADPGGNSSAGETYVVFGKADGTAVNLADVAAGNGGYVINGIDPDDTAFRVSGAGDVNGDGLLDLIVGARLADPSGNTNAGESYVIFGQSSCPWDCGNDDALVGIIDFLVLLQQWGTGNGASCDFGIGPVGVGVEEFLDLLANWGPCP